MSLRKAQTLSYWRDPTREESFRLAFGLPDEEQPLGEVHAVLMMSGEEDTYSGKLYLSTSFLTFTSLDRRSCRLTLPLATVRRVEKLAPGQEGTAVGAFALALTLFHGLRIVLQLNSLRPTNDQFCANLRVRLKAALPLMKTLKPFAKTFFSEWYLRPEREQEELRRKSQEAKVGDLISLNDQGKGKEVEEDQPWTTESGMDAGFHAGLGMAFRFPGDPRKLREKSKMKLWKDYLKYHGRNLTILRYPSFTRLVLVGLPNRLRGEMWELTCGSMFLRLHNPGVYEQILRDNEGRRSASTDDIEKDLHRSLPEYPAYQNPRGIDTLRRVLAAYSWSNPALGYCQAMNLVASSFLIYMSEEQCFWCLTILCDRLLPGYYSPSMYGTVLDQRVFEHLVQKCLPVLHDHFVRADIQLSVASLPWFLSLYISSMPMVFAFRIIDCFFLMGPKVLFQVGLAILKLNGPELMRTTDDGAFINVLKAYFTTLGDSANPHARDPRQRQVTRFQELFVVAFREFSIITDDTITSERKRFRAEVLVPIETFAKRTAIRNLQSTRRLDKDQLGLAYDHFQLAVLKQKERERETASTAPRSRASSFATPGARSPSSPRSSLKPSDGASSLNSPRPPKEETRPEDRIDRQAFGGFIADVSTWARDEKVVKNGLLEHVERHPADHALIDKVFASWDKTLKGSLSFQDVIDGLDGVLFNDLVSSLSWLFNLYDSDRDGYLTKDEILQVSEALLFIFRNEPGDRYLGSVSNLIQNLFEFAETTKPDFSESATADSADTSSSADMTQPFLSLATFRMCILADALLEDFFESDLTGSWRLEVLVPEEKPKPQTIAGGWWRGVVSAVVTDENKERFNRLADEVGKRLDIQTIEQRPSIGKLDAAAAAIEPTARDSLFSTSTSRIKPAPRPAPEPVNPLSAAAMRMPAYPEQGNPWADSHSSPRSPSPSTQKHDIDVQALAQQAMLRPQFAADVATEGEGDDYAGDGDEGGLLGQVDAMLEADDASGKEVRWSIVFQPLEMAQRPPLHQPPPGRAGSPSASTRPPSPARSSCTANPFSYAAHHASAPLYPTSAPSSLARRSSVGGAYAPSGSYRRDSLNGVPTMSYYNTPVHLRPFQPHYTTGAPPPMPAAAASGHTAPTARRLSSASSSHQSHEHDMTDGQNDKRRPKTPPDCCAVCSCTETPEWRKGPAGSRSLCNGCGLLAAKRAKERDVKGYDHPLTLEEIERELRGIGAERFKSPNGQYTLPSGTRQRILTTQDRTRAQQISQQISQTTRMRSRSKIAGQEKAAAASLMGMRRASVTAETPINHSYPSAMAPRSPPASTRGRRSGSLVGQNAHFPSNVGASGSGLPPSSSYMTALGGAGPSSTFSFGHPASHFARPPSPSRHTLAPINPASAHVSSPARHYGLVRPASPDRPISALAASTNRMSIAHLTSERVPSPPAASAAPTSASGAALRRRSASVGLAALRSSSMTRRPTS
ncbi:hypothetical protein JCM11641_007973 [Rhodosporidiobolus odoratus]